MKKIIIRKKYIDKLLSYKDKDIIKVVTGLRRSGKSTLLQMFRDDLSKNKNRYDFLQNLTDDAFYKAIERLKLKLYKIKLEMI